MSLTGKTRYRQNVFGKLILQVEYMVNLDEQDPYAIYPMMSNRYRDATFEDLQELDSMKNKKGEKV